MLEDGKRIRVEEGTPQGGSASLLLANVYLHYVFDLWVQSWRRKQAHGDVIIVRFADDIVVGFQGKSDAKRFQAELTERMRKFDLELPRKRAYWSSDHLRSGTASGVERGDLKRSTFLALRISAERKGALGVSQCYGRRSANGYKRS